MAENEKKTYKVNVQQVDETPIEEPKEPETLQNDPLEELPDLSASTGGLPVVCFVLVCITAFFIMVGRQMLSGTILWIMAGCAVIDIILLGGIYSLIRGMFRRLKQQNADKKWNTIAAIAMTASIVIGVLVGLFTGMPTW